MGHFHSHAHGHSHAAHGHSHGHGRDNMKGVRIGDATCFLTAHLSAADGNELDIFIDNTSGTPLAVSVGVEGAGTGA
jgi:hypothetical protein